MTQRTGLEKWVNLLGMLVLLGAGGLLAREMTRAKPVVSASPALAAIPAKWLQYREIRRIPTGMMTVRALTLGVNGLYVAGDREIGVFASNGAKIQRGMGRHFPLPIMMKVGSLRLPGEPTCITEDGVGDWLIGLGDHVERYSSSGKLLASWASVGNSSLLTGITSVKDIVYVADAGARVVRKYDLQGHQFGQMPKAGLTVPSPYLNVCIANETGQVWVNDPGRHHLTVMRQNGDVLRTIGQVSMTLEGFCGCCNPMDFVVLPDGRFITVEKGIPRVKVYNKDGTLDSVVAGPSDFAPGTAGLRLAADDARTIYLLDPMTRTIRVYQRKS